VAALIGIVVSSILSATVRDVTLILGGQAVQGNHAASVATSHEQAVCVDGCSIFFCPLTLIVCTGVALVMCVVLCSGDHIPLAALVASSGLFIMGLPAQGPPNVGLHTKIIDARGLTHRYLCCICDIDTDSTRHSVSLTHSTLCSPQPRLLLGSIPDDGGFGSNSWTPGGLRRCVAPQNLLPLTAW